MYRRRPVVAQLALRVCYVNDDDEWHHHANGHLPLSLWSLKTTYRSAQPTWACVLFVCFVCFFPSPPPPFLSNVWLFAFCWTRVIIKPTDNAHESLALIIVDAPFKKIKWRRKTKQKLIQDSLQRKTKEKNPSFSTVRSTQIEPCFSTRVFLFLFFFPITHLGGRRFRPHFFSRGGSRCCCSSFRGFTTQSLQTFITRVIFCCCFLSFLFF